MVSWGVLMNKDFTSPLNFHPLSAEEETIRLSRGRRFKRVRIFKSDFLEKFTFVKVEHIFIFWVPVILFLIYWGNTHSAHSLWSNLKLLFSGIFLWTLAEYLIHKYPFHYSGKSEWSKKLVYTMHGNHHDDPLDPLRGVMPIVPAIIYVSLLFGLFNLLLPASILHLVFAGLLIGYLCYDGIHYYTHHAIPKNPVGKYLRRVHLMHHVHEGIMFGISSPLWDFVFGTYIKKDQPIPKEF